MRVLLVGAGGHAEVVADALLAEARARRVPIEVVGYLDDDPARLGKALVGGIVLGRLAEYATFPHDSVIVALGNNPIRQRVFLDLAGKGVVFGTARHPASVIAPNVALGDGVMIMAGVVVNTNARVGRSVILNTSCSVDHHSTIGDHAHVAPGARLGGGVSVGAGALIGIGATVMPRRRVGEGAIVGAGAVVLSDVPDHTTVVGNPARPVARSAKTNPGHDGKVI